MRPRPTTSPRSHQVSARPTTRAAPDLDDRRATPGPGARAQLPADRRPTRLAHHVEHRGLLEPSRAAGCRAAVPPWRARRRRPPAAPARTRRPGRARADDGLGADRTDRVGRCSAGVPQPRRGRPASRSSPTVKGRVRHASGRAGPDICPHCRDRRTGQPVVHRPAVEVPRHADCPGGSISVSWDLDHSGVAAGEPARSGLGADPEELVVVAVGRRHVQRTVRPHPRRAQPPVRAVGLLRHRHLRQGAVRPRGSAAAAWPP